MLGPDPLPRRGTPREDLGTGIRTLAFRRRATIVYSVEPGEVTILGIFHAGLDYEGLVRKP
jgi:toxin ParE1/3/4